MEASLMKLSKNDLGVMRNSLITLAIAVSCGLLLIIFSAEQSELAGKDWRDAQRQLRSAQSELSNAKQDQSNMDDYLAEYSASVNQHLIGAEARLDWVENLEKLHQQKIIEDFRYTIGPQKNYAVLPAIDSGNFNIHYSEMRVQLDLLHEEQLLNFFDAVRSQIKGWYQLEGCTLVRNAIDPKNSGAQLKAECSGGWITLQNRNEKP
jgi:hypothetical protein